MSASVEVQTTSGRLRGVTEDGVSIFRGIPYAAPPVDDRRFRPPAPPPRWDGVRDALEFGPAAPQGMRTRPAAAAGAAGAAATPARGTANFGGLFGSGDLPQSEDCLYLNVWTPAADGARRPVMFWIHGGIFRMGSGGTRTYEARRLAERSDVVVVTINYRLALLGFLHLPSIGAVNLGIRDQIAALQWVHDNIANFGGDADNVTIFGESAGGKSVECLLTSPAAKGLFSRAVMQSTYTTPMDADASLAATKALLAELGLAEDEAEQLRKLSLEQLLEANTKLQMAAFASGAARGGGSLSALSGGAGAGPVIDGEILPQPTLDALRGGAAAGVPVIVGTTRDEAKLFGGGLGGGAEADEDVETRLQPLVAGTSISPAHLATAYWQVLVDRGEEPTAANIMAAVSTDRTFRLHSIEVAEAQSPHAPTWMYVFAFPCRSEALAACHGVEIPFVFGNLGDRVGGFVGDGPEEQRLRDVVQDAWVGFARSDDPNHEGLKWPTYTENRRATMVFDAVSEAVDAPMEVVRRVWEAGRPA